LLSLNGVGTLVACPRQTDHKTDPPKIVASGALDLAKVSDSQCMGGLANNDGRNHGDENGPA
jgi:hypothetical protein